MNSDHQLLYFAPGGGGKYSIFTTVRLVACFICFYKGPSLGSGNILVFLVDRLTVFLSYEEWMFFCIYCEYCVAFLLNYVVNLNNFQILNQTCILGINPLGS